MYEPQTYDIRNIVLSPNKQAAIGTALADAKLTHRLRFEPGQAQATIGKQWFTDNGRAGKGHPWPTERKQVSQDSGVKLGFDLTDFLAGWIPAWSMGKVAVTGAGPYVHTFSIDTTTNQAAVTSGYFEDTAAIKYKLADLVIADWEISGSEVGPLQASCTLLGSGKVTDGAMGAPGVPALPTNVYLLGSDTDILLGAPAAAVSIKERVRQWSVKFTTGMEAHRAPGGGLYASFMKRGIEKVTLSMVIAAKDTDDIRTLYLNDTLQEVQINTNSGAAAQLNLKFPGIYLSGYSLGQNGNEIVYQIESDENAVMKSGANELFSMVVTNSLAAYLIV